MKKTGYIILYCAVGAGAFVAPPALLASPPRLFNCGLSAVGGGADQVTVFDAGETPVSWDDYKKQKPKEYKVCVWCSRVLRLFAPGRGKIKPAALRGYSGDLVSPLVIELQSVRAPSDRPPPLALSMPVKGQKASFRTDIARRSTFIFQRFSPCACTSFIITASQKQPRAERYVALHGL